jgi:hypothetical protein
MRRIRIGGRPAIATNSKGASEGAANSSGGADETESRDSARGARWIRRGRESAELIRREAREESGKSKFT